MKVRPIVGVKGGYIHVLHLNGEGFIRDLNHSDIPKVV